MSIKIHHGAPGSYKTSGALSDDLIPNLKNGRCIVTNVRGLTRSRVIENIPDCPESLEIINYDTSTQAGRDKFKLWFEWVPIGAMIILDEAQMVFPKSWTKNELSLLVIEGTENKDHENFGRPHNFTTAFEMHRHFNWDFIFTTPNIKLIRDDIRLCADGAFHHRDLGAVGINGRYKESYHSATDNPTLANYISVVTKKVNKDVFKLYGSTTTQEHSFTTAGIKIWKDPKILFSFGVLAVSLYFTLSFWFGDSLLNKTTHADEQEITVIPEDVAILAIKEPIKSITESTTVYNDSVVSVDNDKIDSLVHPYSDHDIYIKASLSTPKKMIVIFDLIKDKNSFSITSKDIYASGYRLIYKSPCHIKLIYNDFNADVVCRGSLHTGKAVAGVIREESSRERKPPNIRTNARLAVINRNDPNTTTKL